MKKKTSPAEGLGYAYAHLQHGIDRVITWGFAKMKTIGTGKEKPNPNEKPWQKKTKHGGKKVLEFLGSFGEAYMDKYEELKQKPPSKKS
jgi:hypothetical protein